MKRVVRSKSGREIYGPKWQNKSNMDYSNTSEKEDDNALLYSPQVSDAAPPPPEVETTVVDNQSQTQTSQGIENIRCRVSALHQSMYRASLEGDCVAARMLLEENPNLALDEISEDGDRALHVAASMKHKHLVQKLVERMRPTDLALVDGHGYTACCYAAIAGAVDVADLMMRKNRNLATERDRENKTPLLKAAERGNTEMVSYFLKSARVNDLSTEEWFDILLVIIRRGMYGMALRLSRRNEQLATMTNDDGTALHALARQVFFTKRWQRVNGVMRPDMRRLAKNLWAGMQRLGQANVLELMRNPNILDDAAEVGNVELITMLTHTYPELVWQTNSHGHTIFHIAVKHRHETLFQLMHEIGARKDLIAVSQDQNGNNIFHLAALLAPLDKRILPMPAYQLQKEMMWFKKNRGAEESRDEWSRSEWSMQCRGENNDVRES